MGETRSLSCKRSSRFESENFRLWSAVNSPFETYFYRSEGIHVLEIHVIAVKIEPPLESKQQRNNSYKNSLPRSRFLDVTQRSPKRALRDIPKTAARKTNTRNDRIKNARAQCTAVILFDFSSFVRQTSGKKEPLFESKQ